MAFLILIGVFIGRLHAVDPALPTETKSGTAVQEQVAQWNPRQAIPIGAAGIALCLAAFVAWKIIRSRGAKGEPKLRPKEALKAAQDALEAAKMDLKQQRDSGRHAEEELTRRCRELEQRLNDANNQLTRKCQELQQELDDRKRAEKDLVVQRQELVRSKDVLGLHVQARTQEIQRLKSRYEQVLNSAGEGIYGLDQNGNTTFVNPAAAKLIGRTVEEMVGKPELEVFQRQVLENGENGENGSTAPKGPGDSVLAEYMFRRKDGSSFPVEYNRTPIMENQRLVGAVIILRDITERKRAEESLSRKAAELARSNAELEQFAYVASHDLQEPLRKIQAFGGRLKTKVKGLAIPEAEDYLDRMQNAAARMQNLISDLLTFSRVFSASQPFVSVDVSTVVREVLSDLEVSIEQSNARIECEGLPVIEGDQLQLGQLMQNLISNSIKFQPAGQAPEIKIAARILPRPFSCVKHPTPDDQICELTVKDNGIGFEEKHLDKVFAVFQRLHGRSEYEGTGVGLAVCRRIVDRHGGTITAKSKPGAGATFIVELPVRQNNGESNGNGKAPHE